MTAQPPTSPTPPTPTPTVALRDVKCHYRTPGGVVKAVDGLDLTVEAGECVAVVGPSGSGKSTLLALLGGLERATAGTASVLGTDLGSLSEEKRAAFRRRHIGFVFQDLGLLPFLTATENVAFGIGVAGADDPLDPRDTLEQLQLGAHADRLTDQLSGGERGRVAIARSLAHRPELVLGDEPTGSLDAALSEITITFFLDAVRRLKSAAVVVTHDPTVAARFDRVVRLRDGRVEPAPGGGPPS
jgi:putative ABC transport system ATP-binding protein